MASSKQLALGPMPLQTLERNGDGAVEQPSLAGDLVIRALDRCGISLKEAAITLGLDFSQFSKQLAGKEHLSLQRLVNRMPVMFWAEFIPLLAQSKGLTLQTVEHKRIAIANLLSSIAVVVSALEREA